jgi:formylmethanofuran dehydrogenase subunit E
MERLKVTLKMTRTHIVGGDTLAAKDGTDTGLMSIIERAKDFHGHLGPFLVIGVRMGLIGVRELGVKGREEKLRATAMLRNSVPFSCVIDGIQIATKCTIGNKRLGLKHKSSQIAAKFELQDEEKEVNVLVNPVTFQELKSQLLAEDIPPEEVRKLAHVIASVPEEELFIVQSR